MCDTISEKIESKDSDFRAAQCVCNMEWRAIKPGDDSDDCQCLS